MKKRKRFSSFYIFIILFLLIIMSYIYRFIFLNIDTEIVKYGEMENSFDAKGIIVRNEWTYSFAGNTEVIKKASEGERVPFGKTLAEIVKGEEIKDDLQIRISKLDERIKEIESNANDNNYFEKDSEKLNESIEEKISHIKRLSSEGDFERILGLKDELASDLYKKSLVSGDNSFSGKNLDQLKKEKSQLEELYNTNMDTITAKSAGIVSFNLDGLEQSLNPANIDKFSIEDVKNLVDSLSSIKNKEEKLEGIKVIDNFSWYVCMIVKDEQLNGLKEGSKIKLTFKENKNEPVSAKLKYISEPVDGEVLISCEITADIDNIYSTRLAEVRVVTHEYEGFMVSEKCIVELEEQKGVYVVNEGMVKFIAADVISTENGYALIKNVENEEGSIKQGSGTIKVYDEIVKDTDRVKSNQRVLPDS